MAEEYFNAKTKQIEPESKPLKNSLISTHDALSQVIDEVTCSITELESVLAPILRSTDTDALSMASLQDANSSSLRLRMSAAVSQVQTLNERIIELIRRIDL